MKRLLIAIILISSPYLVEARDNGQELMNASGLVESCKQYLNSIYGEEVYPVHDTSDATSIALQSGFCRGYINGFVSGSSLATTFKSKKAFCIPGGATDEELAKVIVKGLNDHPEFGHAPSIAYVIGIFIIYYPCHG